MRLKLVDEWRQFWRWSSVRLSAAAIAVLPVWEAIPADLRARLPQGAAMVVMALLAAAAIVGRVTTTRPSEKSDG